MTDKKKQELTNKQKEELGSALDAWDGNKDVLYVAPRDLIPKLYGYFLDLAKDWELKFVYKFGSYSLRMYGSNKTIDFVEDTKLPSNYLHRSDLVLIDPACKMDGNHKAAWTNTQREHKFG